MADIDTIRTPGNWSDVGLIIDNPDVIYTARATGIIDESDWTLDFDGGAGTLGNCLEDMTLLIGTTSGGWERGVARLRKAPIAGTFYIGADPSIICSDNDYLTVINDFAPFAKHPVGVLLDVDVAYSDQFSDYTPVAWCNGRVRVIRAGETTEFDATNSWVPDSTITGYSWTFTGATATADTATATPTATYDNSGRFRFALVVTADNGKTYTAYGFVYVLGDNLAAESDILLDIIDVTDVAGGRVRVTMLDRPTIRDGARAVLFADDYYSDARQSFGPVAEMENILLDGRIIGETIVRRPEYDRVEFEIAGPVGFLSEVAALQSGVTDTEFPEDGATDLPAWSKMDDVTVLKGIHHVILWRSTIARCIDVAVEDWEWHCPKLVGTSESLYGQLTEYAGRSAMSVRANRAGQIYCQRDTQVYPYIDRTADIPEIVTLVDGDWQGDMIVVRRQHGDISMVEFEGHVFASGVLFPVGGRSPGNQPARHGGKDDIGELYVSARSELLELAGLYASAKNTEIEAVLLTMAYNCRIFDVTPRMFVRVTVDGQELRCIPRRVSYRRNTSSGFLHTEIELEPEGSQWPAVAIDYPNEDSPPIVPPEEPPPPPPPPTEPPEDPPETSDADAVVVTSDDVRITDDLDEASPTWTSIISGGPTTPVDSDLPETTNDTLYVIEAESVWKCTGVTGTPAWEEVWTASDLTGGTLEQLTRVRVAPGNENLVYVLGYGDSGSGVFRPFVLRSSNGGQTWAESWIDDTLTAVTDYTVTTQTVTKDHNGTIDLDVTFERLGDEGNTYNPWALAFKVDSTDAGGWPVLTADTDTIHDYGASSLAVDILYGSENFLLPAPDRVVAQGWLNEYFGSYTGFGGTAKNLPLAEARVRVNMILGHTSGDQQSTGTAWVFWKYPTIQKPTTLDISRTNNSYIYVGTSNLVWKSTDGGFNWTQSLDHGSNDICIDPQLAGVYYHWAADGGLELVVADAVTGAALDTETPAEIGLRLARDLNSGRLWALKSQTTLRMRNVGSWSDQDTGLTGARGLHAYLGGKLIYLDDSAIYYSDDYGVTQADKTGGWATYADPINAHLMKTT